MEPIVTEEQIGRQPPEAQAIIRILLAKIAKLEAEVEELRRQMKYATFGDTMRHLEAFAESIRKSSEFPPPPGAGLVTGFHSQADRGSPGGRYG